MKQGWQSRAVMALCGSIILTACGDTRLDKLSTGISKDSVAVIMKTDSPHATASYLTNGQLWEIQFYTRKEVALTDSVAWREMSPVVFSDGQVAGWGWTYWDTEAAKLEIPMPPKK